MEGSDLLNIYLELSLVILFGVLGAAAARKVNLPNVTGYLIAGVLLGQSLLHVVGEAHLPIINFVNEMTLGMIAFAIGGEFYLPELKKLGKNIFVITLMEVVGVLTVVFCVMYFVLGRSFAFSMIIASMSASTAPAGTVMVIRQYRADGPLTRTILQVAALDDAFGIMVFGISMSLAKLSLGSEEVNFVQMLLDPLSEIVFSLLLGAVIGLVFTYFVKKITSKETMLCFILLTILGAIGLTQRLGLSALLCNMMIGATLVNFHRNSKRVVDVINDFAPPTNLMFFTFAGASLNLSILSTIGWLGVIYALSRASGKIIGATLGSKMVHAKDTIVKWLGLALLPQGGVAIGMTMIVARELPQFSAEITTLTLFSVLIFEVLGPILSKISITQAGEINGMDKL